MFMKLDRYFGRCPVRGCKMFRVLDGAPYIGSGTTAIPIHYSGYNARELMDAGLYCTEHRKHLRWDQLNGKLNPDKVCNGVCMAARGPSCDCSCGGQNHGKNHI